MHQKYLNYKRFTLFSTLKAKIPIFFWTLKLEIPFSLRRKYSFSFLMNAKTETERGLNIKTKIENTHFLYVPAKFKSTATYETFFSSEHFKAKKA